MVNTKILCNLPRKYLIREEDDEDADYTQPPQNTSSPNKILDSSAAVEPTTSSRFSQCFTKRF
jgi:hypothetical protein